MTRKTSSILKALAVAAASVLAAPVWASDDVVRIAVWGGSPGTAYRTFGEVFTAKTGIPVEVYEMPSANAAIIAADGAPEFNIGVVTGFEVAQLRERGMLREFTQDQLPSMQDYPEDLRLVNEAGDKFVGVPVYYIFYGIGYNTDIATAEDFSSWQSLIDPKWKNRTSVTRPVFMSVYDLTLFSFLNGGDETNIDPGIPFLRKVLENALTVYASMGSFNSMLAQGEIVAGPYYSSVNLLSVQDPSTNFRVTLPDEGGLLLPYAVVQPAGTPESAAAQSFMEFMASTEAQSMLSEYTYLPMNPKATISPAFEEFLGMSPADLIDRLFQPDWNIIAAQQEERVRLVEQIIGEMGL